MKEFDKLEKNLRTFSKNYITILGNQIASLYYYLAIGENSFLFGQFKKIDLTNALCFPNIESIDAALKVLKECELITRPTKSRNNEECFTYNVVDLVKSLTKEEKINMVNKLFDTELINENQKQIQCNMINKESGEIKPIEGDSNKIKPIESALKDTMLKSAPGPNTNKGLVYTYYNMLSNKYGYIIKTTNIDKESHLLGMITKQNHDTPDQIRKMFQWIVDNNKFDLINNLNLYPIMRKRAYHYLFGINDKFEKREYKEGEDEIEFIKQVYDFYIEKGEPKDIIIRKYLYPNYNNEQVDKFINTLEKKDGK